MHIRLIIHAMGTPGGDRLHPVGICCMHIEIVSGILYVIGHAVQCSA